jgi:hypothetical protein
VQIGTVVYDARALAKHVRQSGDTHDPCTRVIFSVDDIERIDKAAGEHGRFAHFCRTSAPVVRTDSIANASITSFLEDSIRMQIRKNDQQVYSTIR